jgi:hypothetical protein
MSGAQATYLLTSLFRDDPAGIRGLDKLTVHWRA